MTQRPPDFDELVGEDVSLSERDRLRRVHDLLVAAGPPPELSPELEAVQWPEEALAPLGLTRRAGSRKRSPLLIAAAVLTIAAAAFLLGQATSGNSPNSIDAQRVVKLKGTALDSDALATLELGGRDQQGNWPMILQVTGLRPLPEGGYYDLYLTRRGKPIALCGSFNVGRRGEATARFTAAYVLEHFDGWVVTRQIPPNHKPTDIVLRPAGSA
ncbi:MAG TPA: hypothetical protein VEL10_03175 [Gaiellaceae bacterium]|nr:hypothetical protein [Gaiellaceae bacterium]